MPSVLVSNWLDDESRFFVAAHCLRLVAAVFFPDLASHTMVLEDPPKW